MTVTHAATSLVAPQNSAVALTYTTYLPLLFNCYPRQAADPAYQYDMNIINAAAAWGRCNLYAGNVTIAIIDTGVDLDHSELQANLLTGYDFVDNDAVPEDGQGHGTNVAGIAAAALNGTGVAGVAPTAKILPVRVLDNAGNGYESDIAAGITYAADHAQVLNLSLGGVNSSATMQNAINYAVSTRGRLVIAAAGNCGGSNFSANGCQFQNQTFYPAAYSNVMAVAATTSTDEHASFSNAGSYVDVAAPGVGIYNTYPNNAYAAFSGTSQATPHVSGLAALVWAQNPGYAAAQVWSRITSTAVDLGPAGVDAAFGAGRIDVRQALGLTALRADPRAAHPTEAAQGTVIDQRTAAIAPGRIVVKFKDTLNAASVSRVLAALPQAEVSQSIQAIEAQVLRVPVGTEWTTIDRLRARPEVEYAEPDYVLHLIR
ncbi:MAG TPA: S8 family serine peptidase [Anaerolineae bacterium]|nr:S8 family serine peptidase [Anaerolineae bacterium]